MVISLSALFIYTAFVLFLLVALVSPKKKQKSSNKKSGVSVVIPFKNEVTNLPALISSLSVQDYKGPVEVVFVNDGSIDGSVSTINSLRNDSPFEIVLLNSDFDPDIKTTSKQQALDLGIRRAKNEWVALTDADMRLEPDFISSFMNSLSADSALVFGHTSIICGNNILEKIQAFQLEFLFAIAYAFHLADITGSCMGNNILISRSAYIESGGQRKIGYNITEDRALVSLFRQQKRQVNRVEPFKTTAYTYPEKKIGSFIGQMRRWAQGGFHLQSNLLPLGVLFSIQNIFFLIAIAGLLPSTLTTATVLNFILTWTLIAVSFWKIRSPGRFLFFPLYYVFLLFQTVLLTLFFLSGKQIEWKGRKI